MDSARYSMIEMRRKRRGVDRPVIRGTRMEVANIAADAEFRDMTADEIAAAYDHLTLTDVHAALPFYHTNKAELRAMIADDEQYIQRMKLQQH